MVEDNTKSMITKTRQVKKNPKSEKVPPSVLKVQKSRKRARPIIIAIKYRRILDKILPSMLPREQTTLFNLPDGRGTHLGHQRKVICTRIS